MNSSLDDDKPAPVEARPATLDDLKKLIISFNKTGIVRNFKSI
jgi:hypothetical protein